MDRKQRRAAEERLQRATAVVAAGLARADDGDEYFGNHRDAFERLRDALAPYERGEAGTKRLIALSRDIDEQLGNLERDYTSDRERRAAEAKQEAERERHQRLREAKVLEDARGTRRASAGADRSLGILFDMRNDGPG